MKVAIIGGGITGLVAAYELGRTTDFKIDLYEASTRLGGKIATFETEGLLVEQGPDCFFTRKSGVMELVGELGLEGELIDPLRSEFAMLVGGQLHAVPRGLVALGNIDPECVLAAGFLSDDAKERALSSPLPGDAGTDVPDISIRNFFTQKYGADFSRLVVEPLLAGTHGGDPAKLSMQALYPGYLAPPPAPSTGSGPTFKSFKQGMETLTEALQKAIEGRVTVHLNASIQTLEEVDADQYLVAVPAPVAAALLPTVSPLLTKITHRGATIVTFAFPRSAIQGELPYTGFLVPEGEHPVLTGSTWSSEKWEGRTSKDKLLIRVFVKEGVTTDQALQAIRPIMGIEGEPILHATKNWINAQPQYELGHLDLVEEIEAEVRNLGNIVLAGTSYRGVGIPDCIRQGRDAAHVVVDRGHRS